METPDRPLRGRSVLLTRPDGSGEELARRLADLGARVESRPAIALEPPRDRNAVRRALADLDRYDWVVFTSANGVRFFVEARRESESPIVGIAAGIAAIGSGTSDALREAGMRPALVAEESSSEGLAHALEARVTAGQHVLLVRPEVARSTLAELLEGIGARCDAVPFYRNVAAPGVEVLVREIRDRQFDVIVLTAPSALQRMLEVPSVPRHELIAALGCCRLVAIGPVTAAAIERAGLTPASIARQPTDDGIVECVLSLYP